MKKKLLGVFIYKLNFVLNLHSTNNNTVVVNGYTKLWTVLLVVSIKLKFHVILMLRSVKKNLIGVCAEKLFITQWCRFWEIFLLEIVWRENWFKVFKGLFAKISFFPYTFLILFSSIKMQMFFNFPFQEDNCTFIAFTDQAFKLR